MSKRHPRPPHYHGIEQPDLERAIAHYERSTTLGRRGIRRAVMASAYKATLKSDIANLRALIEAFDLIDQRERVEAIEERIQAIEAIEAEHPGTLEALRREEPPVSP
jgi:hypothetical protein